MADKQLVLAIFADEAAADAAVTSLKSWAEVTKGIWLGAIGVLVVDEAGHLKEHKLGARSGGKGAGIGLLLAVVAPPTLLVGMAGGSLLGHFHHKGLRLSAEDRERIGGELPGGQGGRGGPGHSGRGGCHLGLAHRARRRRRNPRGDRGGTRGRRSNRERYPADLLNRTRSRAPRG